MKSKVDVAQPDEDDNFAKQDEDPFGDETLKPEEPEGEIDNTKPAGDEFLVWEPRNLFENV